MYVGLVFLYATNYLLRSFGIYVVRSYVLLFSLVSLVYLFDGVAFCRSVFG